MTQPVRIGILGCARIVKTALIDIAPLAPEIVLVAVASRSLERSETFAKQHGIPKAYGSYASMLADTEIDAIYVPLPNSMHAEWSIRALDAGKAVLCEKPLASNAQEALAMANKAHASGRPLVEAFHYRYHPLAEFVARTLQSRSLGAIKRVYASLEVPGSLVPKDDIRFQFSLAGGALMDVGAYCMNACRFATGEEPTIERANPTLVSENVDGAMHAGLRFPSGAIGEIQCSLVAPGLATQLKIEGENGWIVADNPFLPQLGHKVEMEVEGVRTEHTFDLTPTYAYQARAFAGVVRGDVSPRTTAEDGVANMRAIDSVYRTAGLEPRR